MQFLDFQDKKGVEFKLVSFVVYLPKHLIAVVLDQETDKWFKVDCSYTNRFYQQIKDKDYEKEFPKRLKESQTLYYVRVNKDLDNIDPVTVALQTQIATGFPDSVQRSVGCSKPTKDKDPKGEDQASKGAGSGANKSQQERKQPPFQKEGDIQMNNQGKYSEFH